MELILKELPESLQHYTGKSIPKWMRMLHPEAADSVLQLEKDSGGLVYNDVWRSAEVSLWAMKQKSGVMPPSFSGHNFGLSIDFAVEHTLKKLNWTYAQFLKFLEDRRWFCHRRDAALGSESWHFNFLPNGLPVGTLDVKKPATWALPVEQRMLLLYSEQLLLTPSQVQAGLKQLKMYSGDVDGILGPISSSAISVFQRAWGLPVTGEPNKTTQRTLAFVTATKKITPVGA